jgi:pyruvate ferredoxin oxidoreductase gamma subunit
VATLVDLLTMYRIRFHGRGGQGVKTAARILGSAFFAEGFEVQDAPRYGAERRGAPIFATVRAARAPIHERGAIAAPDLVVVADETLVPIATAGVLGGVGERAVLLIRSAESAATWRERLHLAGAVVVLPDDGSPGAARSAGATCAGAAARLAGVISRAALLRAVEEEVAELGADAVAASVAAAGDAFERMAPHHGCVREGEAPDLARLAPPDWVELPLEPAERAAPDVFATATSVAVRTGLWRTWRPVVDHSLCHRCTWVCVTACPDAAIARGEDGGPVIDYEHCKGCLVCVAVCPPHAIHAVPEREAGRAQDAPR